MGGRSQKRCRSLGVLILGSCQAAILLWIDGFFLYNFTEKKLKSSVLLYFKKGQKQVNYTNAKLNFNLVGLIKLNLIRLKFYLHNIQSSQ